jgi:glycogen operon protein
LRNFWGYNSIGFFALEPRYLASGSLGEFKTFIQIMHQAGIEVILDVVYNHTAEGDRLGPTLCFRGIDNASYYRLDPTDAAGYADFTGCGNAFNLHHPRVLQLVMDSLRYWVEEMHVDGFRFDLASTLAREREGEFDTHSGFLDAAAQDPVLAKAKLIAEPWDTGPGGYQLGSFPPRWTEWNDRYRDTVRRFWRGDEGVIGEFATRITGSSDLFRGKGRRPHASINFVTAHDGFTLRDLVSYAAKHNEANGEGNRDGSDANYSWNCGVEGPTDDPEVRRLRLRQTRNMLATLLLSQGVPMLLAGDEIGRSQAGNNNAYCQDNEIGWIDWSLRECEPDAESLRAFVRRLLEIRRGHIVFHRRRFFREEKPPAGDGKDIIWLRPDGKEKGQEDWTVAYARCLGYRLNGEAGLYHMTAFGEPQPDDDFFVVMNAHDDVLTYHFLKADGDDDWEILIDTARDTGLGDGATVRGSIKVQPGSFALLVRRRAEPLAQEGR